MDFDKILDEIGEFGRYQKTKYYLLCLPVFFCAANSLSYVFTAGSQHYRCLIPECESAENARYDANWLQHALPGEIQLDGRFKIDHCRRYQPIVNRSQSLDEICPAQMFSNETIKCDQWVFDKSSHTIVQQWNLTCEENEWKLPFVGTVHVAGVIVGYLWMACGDIFGRKMTLIVSTLFMSLTGIGQALAVNYEMFVIFAFLNAIGVSGIYPLAFVLGLEMVGKQKRGLAGMACNYFYSIGVAILGVTAWACNNYVMLQLLISIIPMILVIYYWIVPESVRWLLTKNKNKQAIKIIKTAAKVNGKTLSEATLAQFKELEAAEVNPEMMVTRKAEQKGEIWETIKGMLSNKSMFIRILILLFNFAINAMVYLGLSLNSVSLSGNQYLNFVLVSMVEIPGNYLGLVTIDRFGRVNAFIGSMILCGITCISCGYVVTAWVQIALFLVGKLGITCSFSIIFVHATEMMPTVIRSSSVGFFARMGQMGALAAPFAPFLTKYYKPLPYIVFGLLAISGAVMYFYQPETLNRKLPNTVEEATRLNLQPQLNDETPQNQKDKPDNY